MAHTASRGRVPREAVGLHAVRSEPRQAATSTRVRLCGALAVEVDGRDVTAALPGRQGRRLFAYLIANRGRPVRRSELTEVVWPDAPPGAPDIALRSLL